MKTLYIIYFFLLSIIACQWFYRMGKEYVQEEAVSRDLAYYAPKTKEFKWREKV